MKSEAVDTKKPGELKGPKGSSGFLGIGTSHNRVRNIDSSDNLAKNLQPSKRVAKASLSNKSSEPGATGGDKTIGFKTFSNTVKNSGARSWGQK